MATKKGSFQAVVGYARLPSRTKAGSHADFNKASTKSARQSMAQIIRQVEQIFRQAKGALPEVLESALQPTFDKSQDYCPVDTGTLKESGKLFSGFADGRAFASITYGNGGAVHYAAMVHERTDLNHAFPTRAKYLQTALEEDIGGIRARIHERLRVS